MVCPGYARSGGARWKFWKHSLRGAKILFYGSGLKCFSPLRGTNSKTTHYLVSDFFRLRTFNGTAKALAADLLRLNTRRGTKTTFLPLKGRPSTPVLFIWESSSGGSLSVIWPLPSETVRLFVIIGLVRDGPSPKLREFWRSHIEVCAIFVGN